LHCQRAPLESFTTEDRRARSQALPQLDRRRYGSLQLGRIDFLALSPFDQVGGAVCRVRTKTVGLRRAGFHRREHESSFEAELLRGSQIEVVRGGHHNLFRAEIQHLDGAEVDFAIRLVVVEKLCRVFIFRVPGDQICTSLFFNVSGRFANMSAASRTVSAMNGPMTKLIGQNMTIPSMYIIVLTRRAYVWYCSNNVNSR
jgi:hypothetical protein